MTELAEWNNLLYRMDDSVYDNMELKAKLVDQIATGKVSKEQDPINHVVVYFLPFNPKTNKVFLVFDKRIGGLWIGPGGHVDPGESPREAASRELSEELGITKTVPQFPFYIALTHATNPNRACKIHYDFWYLVASDGTGFKLTEDEFSEHKWLSLREAYKLVEDPSTKGALLKLLKNKLS